MSEQSTPPTDVETRDPILPPEDIGAWFRREQVRLRFEARLGRAPVVTWALILSIIVLYLITGVDDWIAGRSGVLGILFHGRSDEALQLWGARERAMVSEGEVWRLSTCIFLHANPLHLGLNALALLGLGRACEAVHGPLRLLFLFLVCGIGGSVASQVLGHASGSVGASGAIFGLMGATPVFALRFRSELPPAVLRAFTTGLAPWVILNLFIGFAMPRIDTAGHLGGLATGALLGLVLGNGVIPGKDGSRLRLHVMLFLVAALVGWGLASLTVYRFF